MVGHPLFPASDPATSSFNGLHPKKQIPSSTSLLPALDFLYQWDLYQWGRVLHFNICPLGGAAPTNKHWVLFFMEANQEMTFRPAAAAMRDWRRSKVQNPVAPSSNARATCSVSNERHRVPTP